LRIADERPYSQPGKEIQGEANSKYFTKAKKLLDVSINEKMLMFSTDITVIEEGRCWRSS
jgi:hypothetical protein